MSERIQTHRLVVGSIAVSVIGLALLVAPPLDEPATLVALAGVAVAYVCLAASIELTARAASGGITAALTAPSVALAMLWTSGALYGLAVSAAFPILTGAAHLAVFGVWMATMWLSRAAVDAADEARATAVKGEAANALVVRAMRSLTTRATGDLHPLSPQIVACQRRLAHAPLKRLEDPETAVALDQAIEALTQSLGEDPATARARLDALEQLLDEKGL
jgi:hypothetical protein